MADLSLDPDGAQYMEMFRPKTGEEQAGEEPKLAEKLLQLQLARYRRRLKIAKTEKRSRQDRALFNIVKTRLDKLKLDEHHLINEGAMCFTEKEKKAEHHFLPRLASLIQENAYLEAEINNLKSDMKDLDKANYKLIAKVKEIDTKNSIRNSKSEKEMDDRFMMMLQRKVSTAMIEFNKTMESCKMLREDIEILLMEREKFNLATERLFNKVRYGKVLMMDLMEQALETFEKREEAKEELKCMQNRCLVYKDGRSKQSRQMQKFKQMLDVEVNKAIFQSIKSQVIIMGDYASMQRMHELLEIQKLEDGNFRSQLLLYKVKYLLNTNSLSDALKAFQDVDMEATSLYQLVVTLFCESQALSTKHRLLKYVCSEVRYIYEDWVARREARLKGRKEELREAKRNADSWVKHTESIWNWIMITFSKLEELAIKVGAPLRTVEGQVLEVTMTNVDAILKDIELGVADLTNTLIRVESSNNAKDLPLGRYLVRAEILEEASAVAAAAAAKMPAGQLNTPCALCTEMHRIAITREVLDVVLPYGDLENDIKAGANNLTSLSHSVQMCALPGSTKYKMAARQIASKKLSCV